MDINAPEFPDKLMWLNGPFISMAKLTGKVVLIDFWTYSCINCQRTLPYLKKWSDKYQKFGFVLIGVHAPEFDFEKDPENVKKALKMYEVDWPVILDNKLEIWNLYANHYWPAKYLVDHNGKIIYSHFGEGNYIETEIKIQEALKEAGYKVDDKLVSGSQGLSLEAGQTPELYFGSLRGHVENIPQDISLQPDQIYTTGKWFQEKEYIQHARVTKDLDDLIILSYRAKKVFLVMESEDSKPVKVYVTLDGVGLNKDNAGEGIKFDEVGRSYVEVQFSTLYNLISTQTFGDHILRLSATSDKLRCFAFTFGS